MKQEEPAKKETMPAKYSRQTIVVVFRTFWKPNLYYGQSNEEKKAFIKVVKSVIQLQLCKL